MTCIKLNLNLKNYQVMRMHAGICVLIRVILDLGFLGITSSIRLTIRNLSVIP